jgi:hypothetical protein
MDPRKVAIASLAFTALACASSHSSPELAMPRDPWDHDVPTAASDEDESPPPSSSERVAARAAAHQIASLHPSASASTAPPPEPPPTLVLADGTIDPRMMADAVTGEATAPREALLTALGFDQAELDGRAGALSAPGEIFAGNVDGAPDIERVIHVVRGEPTTPETHYIAWLKLAGRGLKPIGLRVEHVRNACCEGAKANGSLSIEVMPVHSANVVDTVIHRTQTADFESVGQSVSETDTTGVWTLEHGNLEEVFHWQGSAPMDGPRESPFISEGIAPKEIRLLASNAKAKRTYKFDPKAFLYK